MKDVRVSGLAAKVAIVVALLSMAVAACTEESDPGAVTTTTAAPQENNGAQIPEEFPEPGEVQELDVLTLTDEDIHVQWEVAMNADEVVEFYSQSLPDEGWQISSQREGGDSTRFAISGHGWNGAVTVLGGDPVRVLLQLGISEGE